MKLNFICAQHLSWLAQHPEAAFNTSSSSYERALDLVEEGRPAEAIRYAGCAVETAHLLLDQLIDPDKPLLQLFIDASSLLSEMLAQVQETALAGQVRGGLMIKLEQLRARDLLPSTRNGTGTGRPSVHAKQTVRERSPVAAHTLH